MTETRILSCFSGNSGSPIQYLITAVTQRERLGFEMQTGWASLAIG